MEKLRVKMQVSIAGIGDPSPAMLSKKYQLIEADLKRRKQGREVIEEAVALAKAKDAAEPRRGFAQDFSFKPGDEVLLEAYVARKWEASGICVILA